jgi:hypothetical protein
VGHYPFKTLNKQLSVVRGQPKGGWPIKALERIRSCPFKTSRPPEEGWPQNKMLSWLKSSLDQLQELVPQGPKST